MIALCGMLLACLVAVAGAASANAIAASDQALPFEGTWTNSENPPVANPPAGCDQFFTTTQSGRATDLGRFTGTGETCAFNVRVVDESPIPGVGAPPFFVAEFAVEQTLTAANGDTLLVRTDDGVFVMSSDGSSRVAGTIQVVGGSGRFEGATGNAVGSGAGADIHFAGWIDYDASSASS